MVLSLSHGNLRFRDVLTKDFLEQTYINEQLSSLEIAKQIGTDSATVRNYLNRYGIPIRTFARHRKYGRVDASGFLNLVDDWHAYWIGFVAADGCISDTAGLRVQIAISEKDIDLLYNFAEGMGDRNLVTTNTPRSGFAANKTVAKVIIHDGDLVRAFMKWGVIPRKSLVIQWPDHFPDHLKYAYIRGYFDGNGAIYQRHRVQPNTQWTETNCRFTCGSPAFLTGLEIELNKHGIKTNKRFNNAGTNTHALPLSGTKANLLAFKDFMYQNCSVSLPRKREIFDLL